MSKRILIALFDSEADAVGAVHAMRGMGQSIVDGFSPFPCEELNHAVGIKPSRLVWACFLFGLAGAGLIALFQFWASASDWAIDVGGKPWNSLPAFTPVIFEMMVLFAGLGVVTALFCVCGLYPGKQAKMVAPQSADNKISILIEHSSAAYKLSELKEALEQFNLAGLDEYIDEGGRK